MIVYVHVPVLHVVLIKFLQVYALFSQLAITSCGSQRSRVVWDFGLVLVFYCGCVINKLPLIIKLLCLILFCYAFQGL